MARDLQLPPGFPLNGDERKGVVFLRLHDFVAPADHIQAAMVELAKRWATKSTFVARMRIVREKDRKDLPTRFYWVCLNTRALCGPLEEILRPLVNPQALRLLKKNEDYELKLIFREGVYRINSFREQLPNGRNPELKSLLGRVPQTMSETLRAANRRRIGEGLTVMGVSTRAASAAVDATGRAGGFILPKVSGWRRKKRIRPKREDNQ